MASSCAIRSWPAAALTVGLGCSAAVAITTGSPAPANAATVAVVVPRGEVDEVVRRAQRGDSAAFAQLFRDHRAAVLRIAFRMLGPHADLDDVVQEVFLQVHRSLPEFQGKSKFTTWLYRVTVNVVLMARRRARSRPILTAYSGGHHQADQSPLPDEELARDRRLAAFRRLLDRLSDKKRTVFVLHELEGLAPAQIAEIVSCPVLTVRTRLFYARRELAQMIRADPDLGPMAGLDRSEARADRPRGEGQGAPSEPAPLSSPTTRDPGEVT